MNAASRVDWLRRIENGLLAALVLTLVLLSGAQIFLRIFFETGLSWADPFSRGLVLWTGMLGALAAVRDEKHIALDLLQRYLTPALQRIVRFVTYGFAALLCAAMAWYCFDLVRIDYASGVQAGGGVAAGLQACFAESILPLGFALMALRFVLRLLAPPAHTPALMHHLEAPAE